MSNFVSSFWNSTAAGKLTKKPSAPAPPPPPPRPTPQAQVAATPGQGVEQNVPENVTKKKKVGPAKSQTVYTSTLGLSTAEKSDATTKTLTGL